MTKVRTDTFSIGDDYARVPQMVVGPDHVLRVVWLQVSSKSLQTCAVTARGTQVGDTHTIISLNATWAPNELWTRLLRSNSSSPDDFFKGFNWPALAVNPDPTRASHLYVVYADSPQSGSNDRSDIFFVKSTDGGTTWHGKQRVNLDVTSNDQWMPVIAVRPNGNQLFVGWNDRRLDTSGNSMIDVYGRFGTIAANGDVTLAAADFRITTESFPPAFSGTLSENTTIGHYDPVWPPGGVPLDWWYPGWWPMEPWGPTLTDPAWAHEAGEHNGAYADTSRVYFAWSDNRSASQGTRYPGRRQADIRMARISWPVP